MVTHLRQKGFTLIELLVVIGIIVLLSTIALTQLSSAREKARDARRFADVKSFQTSLELYYSDQREYPQANSLILGPDGTTPMCLSSDGFGTDVCGADRELYMNSVPRDPGTNDYEYSSTDGESYEIRFMLERDTADYPGDTPICAGPGAIIVCQD